MEYMDNNGNVFEADEILPCPCCSGIAELTFKGNDRTRKRSTTIRCTQCFLKRTDAALRNNQEWCAKTSIKNWNKRCTP